MRRAVCVPSAVAEPALSQPRWLALTVASVVAAQSCAPCSSSDLTTGLGICGADEARAWLVHERFRSFDDNWIGVDNYYYVVSPSSSFCEDRIAAHGIAQERAVGWPAENWFGEPTYSPRCSVVAEHLEALGDDAFPHGVPAWLVVITTSGSFGSSVPPDENVDWPLRSFAGWESNGGPSVWLSMSQLLQNPYHARADALLCDEDDQLVDARDEVAWTNAAVTWTAGQPAASVALTEPPPEGQPYRERLYRAQIEDAVLRQVHFDGPHFSDIRWDDEIAGLLNMDIVFERCTIEHSMPESAFLLRGDYPAYGRQRYWPLP